MMVRAIPASRSLPLVIALAVAFILILGGCETKTSDKSLKFISVAQVRKLALEADRKSNPTLLALVDPRPAREFNEGHIPRARNITLASLPPDGLRTRELEGFDNLIVYGNDPGSASARAMAKRLIQLGYDKVFLMQEGIKGWEAQGGAIQPPRAPAQTTPPPAQ